MGTARFLVFFLATSAWIVRSAEATRPNYKYLQEYPPVNKTDGRIPLHFATVLSFGGEYVSVGALPGVQIALDYINSERSILPGYSLHYSLAYSECNRSMAFASFHKQINFGPTKVGWIGSGCSIATEITAALTQYYNISHLSCVSSSPELRNRPRYRYYFQMLATEVLIAQGFYGIIQNFGWKRVGIISQDENLFTQSVDVLRQSLNRSEVEVTEKRFRSDDGIYSITQLFDLRIRIYVLTMYSPHARNILCEAYRRGLRYPKYTFVTYGWYVSEWWKGSNDRNCTGYELASLITNSFAPIIREFPMDDNQEGEPGITVEYFDSEYDKLLKTDSNEAINLGSYIDDSQETFLYAYHCHEGMLTLAYALNKTIADLAENETLNREAAEESGLPEGETFTMANFTYANSAVVSRMFEHL
jgi:gamma-aminobutyric acid type B receptor